MTVRSRGKRVLAALSLGALLQACGGGGGGDPPAAPTLSPPPTTAATLTQSGTEAAAAVQALNGGSATIVRHRTTLDGGGLFGPLASAAPAPLAGGRAAPATQRERALAAQSFACTQLVPAPCSGSLTIDTNAVQSGNVIPAGTFVAITYHALSFSSGGQAVQLNGTFRVDFLSAFDVNSTSLANMRMLLTIADFGGSVDGVAFGPVNAVALLEFDASGVASLTIEGVQITGVDGIAVTDADDYHIAGTRLRAAHWSATSRYVDLQFSNWTVVAGRPTVNSSASVSAGSGAISITVSASSSASVVYDVVLTIGGIAVRYTVTATYAPGSSTPTYSVVVAG